MTRTGNSRSTIIWRRATGCAIASNFAPLFAFFRVRERRSGGDSYGIVALGARFVI